MAAMQPTKFAILAGTIYRSRDLKFAGTTRERSDRSRQISRAADVTPMRNYHVSTTINNMKKLKSTSKNKLILSTRLQ